MVGLSLIKVEGLTQDRIRTTHVQIFGPISEIHYPTDMKYNCLSAYFNSKQLK